MSRVVHLDHQLPRRSRQNRPINSECIVPTQRRGKIAAQIQAVILLQFIEMLVQIRTDITDRCEQVIDHGRRILNYKAGHQICVRRDIFERFHGRWLREP